MTRPWWDLDADPGEAPVLTEDGVPSGAADADAPPATPIGRHLRPRLFPVDAQHIADEIRGRQRDFTPAWTSQHPDDPGQVMIELAAAQIAAVATAVDEVPLKARVELLATGGIGPIAPRPVSTTLVFQISASASTSSLVPAGFQASGRDGAGRDVTFETTRSMFAAPATVGAVLAFEDDLVERFDVPVPGSTARVSPFGIRPKPGNALLIGLTGAVAPSPSVAIGFFLAPRDGAPPAVARGGIGPLSPPIAPLVTWEVYDGRDFVPAELHRDETAAFTKSGIVELGVPRRWEPRPPPGVTVEEPMRWLRARIAVGKWAEPPVLAGVALNCVPADSGITVRNEILAPTGDPQARRRQMALGRAPVLADSLVLEVDEGDPRPRRWQRVDQLSDYPGDARVYVLDAKIGVVTFGDGVHGLPLPEGFNHVHAATYRVAIDSSAIAAGAITTMLSSAPFATGVSNPFPIAAATPIEDLTATLRRGPRELRARGRAVTPADYEVCALHAPGGDVRRTFAIPGFHPSHVGRPLPGVVSVIVVPSDREDGNPPMPDEGALAAVAAHLTREAAPAGVEVVAFAPSYERVRVELAVVTAADQDVGQVVNAVITSLDNYLHPLTGGDGREGWPFGGVIRHVAVVRRVLADLRGAAIAIPRLNIVVGGRRSLGCVDVAIPKHALLWPDVHEVVPLREGELP